MVKQGGVKNQKQLLLLCRQMLKIYAPDMRLKVVGVLMKTFEIALLRQFLDYHGLQILWGWMVEATEPELKENLLHLLNILPITNKTALTTIKVWALVQRWSEEEDKVADNAQLAQNEQSNAVMIDETKAGSPAIKNETEENSHANTDEIEENSHANKDEQENIKIHDNLMKYEKATAEKEEQSETSKKISSIDNENVEQKSTESAAIESKTSSIRNLALKLLDKWKDLREVFRIPRASKRQEEKAEDVNKENKSQEADQEKKQDGHHRHHRRRHHYHQSKHSYKKKFRHHELKERESNSIRVITGNRVKCEDDNITDNTSEEEFEKGKRTKSYLSGKNSRKKILNQRQSDNVTRCEYISQILSAFSLTQVSIEDVKLMLFNIRIAPDQDDPADLDTQEARLELDAITFDGLIHLLESLDEVRQILQSEDLRSLKTNYGSLLIELVGETKYAKTYFQEFKENIQMINFDQNTEEFKNCLEEKNEGIKGFEKIEENNVEIEKQDVIEVEEDIIEVKEEEEIEEVVEESIEEVVEESIEEVVEETIEEVEGEEIEAENEENIVEEIMEECEEEIVEECEEDLEDEFVQQKFETKQNGHFVFAENQNASQKCSLPQTDDFNDIVKEKVITFNHQIPAEALDNTDYSQIKYEVDNENLCKQTVPRIHDQCYPLVGIYYVTPSGVTYFLALQNDNGVTTINFLKNITSPLALDFTQKLTDKPLPPGWKSHCHGGNYYYYNKEKNISQWHSPN